jgi:hypothetical protein
MLLALAPLDMYSESAKWFRLRRFQGTGKLAQRKALGGHIRERE